jgi:GH15 family glucan-1,4-alpha-glucosidase
MYLPETNVLMTRFLGPEGVGEIVDFMPMRSAQSKTYSDGQIIRIVRGVRGAVHFTAECRPAFDYARATHSTYLEPNLAVFEGAGVRMALASSRPLERDEDGVVSEFVLKPNETATFVLQYMNSDRPMVPGDLTAYTTRDGGARLSFDRLSR